MIEPLGVWTAQADKEAINKKAINFLMKHLGGFDLSALLYLLWELAVLLALSANITVYPGAIINVAHLTANR